MIELSQTFEGGFDRCLVSLRHLTACPNAKQIKVLFKWIVVYSTDKSQCIEVEGSYPHQSSQVSLSVLASWCS